MYKTNLTHDINLEDIKKGMKLNEIRTIDKRMSLEFIYVHLREPDQRIYFYRDGRIISETMYGVKKGIELLKEVGITLLNPYPPIHKV